MTRMSDPTITIPPITAVPDAQENDNDAPLPPTSPPGGATASSTPGAKVETGSASKSGTELKEEEKADEKKEKEAEALPPLTPAEFKVYNRLAEQMEYFHDHFRQIWITIHTACVNNKRPPHLSLRQFIDEGLRLTRYLESHHTIEETALYPLLARKMPQFRQGNSGGRNKRGGDKGGGGGSEKNHLLKQHQEIHAGMDVYTDYLRACKNRETELELGVLRDKMDSWGEVLMTHLEDEVRELGADVMRRYWTLEEMRAIPI